MVTAPLFERTELCQRKKRVRRYPAEVRERAVRMELKHEHEYASQWKAIESISAKLGINHQTLRNWVNRAETDAGRKPGLSTDERARMKALEKENKELKRANEMTESSGGCNEGGFGFLRGGDIPSEQKSSSSLHHV